jgi:hypothetical protein
MVGVQRHPVDAEQGNIIRLKIKLHGLTEVQLRNIHANQQQQQLCSCFTPFLLHLQSNQAGSWDRHQLPIHTAVVLAVSLLAAVQCTASGHAHRNNMLNKNAKSFERTTAGIYFGKLP